MAKSQSSQARTESDSDGPRVPPDGSAYKVAQQEVTDRNDAARKAGMEQRQAQERKVAAARRAEQDSGRVFR
jgi:hypothetical protein